MESLYNLTHLKERYRAVITDRSVNLHATLAEMLGTGMLVLIGTGAVQLATDATDAKGTFDSALPLSFCAVHVKTPIAVEDLALGGLFC